MKIIKNLLALLLFSAISTSAAEHRPIITVRKAGVTHKFLSFDRETDEFVRIFFSQWETETFKAFEKVKDPQGIAIDLGAWIGTTAIWLSKNFHHVIAVEADVISLKCLADNLKASNCPNVSLCPFPIAATQRKVFFGPRGSKLNESISQIKEVNAQSPLDYSIESITLKQLIEEYIFSNKAISGKKISFIKCDIEGGEEEVMEDVLLYAYEHKIPVHMSFHYSWWRSKKIADFASLFTYFETRSHIEDVCQEVENYPFCSILLFPKMDAGQITSVD